MSTFAITKAISRDGAVVARWAHNPKVAGSSPAPATKSEAEILGFRLRFFVDLDAVRRLQSSQVVVTMCWWAEHSCIEWSTIR